MCEYKDRIQTATIGPFGNRPRKRTRFMIVRREPVPTPGSVDSLTTRRADASDAPVLLEMSTDMALQCSAGEFSDHLCELLDSAENEVFVARFNAFIAGWAHVFVTRRLGIERFAEIGGLVTRQQYRHRGVGRALVRQCEIWARHNHRAYLRVRCNARRRGAHEFYEKTGFERVKNQVVYEKCL